MRHIHSTLALFAVCGAVLATSSAKAQFVALPLHLDVTSLSDMAVTQYGATTNCSSQDIRSDTSHYVLQPEVGSTDQGSRVFWCGEIRIDVQQWLEVTKIYHASNYSVPSTAQVRTIIMVTTQDGTVVSVANDDSTWRFPTTPSPWTVAMQHDPQNIPGVVF
jgi:hypothetical protein